MSDIEREELVALRIAARRFIYKCESGQAQSDESYKQFKEALAIGDEKTDDQI